AKKRLVFLCVGSSGAVYPAAGIVDVVKDLGAETWLVNAEPADNTGSFDTFLEGKAGEILPTLLSA
ncbi:MAG TPA: NAD-dependent protein deacylase, partial [Byssovorax sp.]